MDGQIPDRERSHLRALARKQAAYAALPVMARRKQMWFDLNDGRPGTPCTATLPNRDEPSSWPAPRLISITNHNRSDNA
jgi:hypothetical protein